MKPPPQIATESDTTSPAATPLRLLVGELSSEATGDHAHDTHQWLRVTEGLMLFEDGHKRHVLSGQNAAFIPKGLLHNAEARGQRVCFESIYAAPLFYEEMMSATQEAHAAGHPGLALPAQIVVFQASRLWRELLAALCARAEAAEEPMPDVADATTEAMLRLLWLMFAEERGRLLPIALPQSQAPTLQPALAAIDDALDRPWTAAELARLCHVSPRTLQRAFQRELGCTPFGYLRLHRIFAATVALATTDAPILTIAMDVGYDSLSAFYQAFTELTGMTPRQYRAQSQ